jgi:uncharacterized protein YjbJ (UPF0337 family)
MEPRGAETAWSDALISSQGNKSPIAMQAHASRSPPPKTIGGKTKKGNINKRSRPRSTSRILINADSSLVKSSTKDKIKGRIDEAKGRVKEKTGEAAGDSDLRDRGTAEKAGGKIQRKIGDVKKVFEK